MTLQADSSGFKWKRIDTTAIPPAGDPHTAAPSNGNDLDPNAGGTPPDFVTSPRAVSQQATTGILLALQQTEHGNAIFNAGGVSLIVWLRDPHSWRWQAFSTITIDYAQLFVTYDVDAAELYFQISAGIAVGGLVDIGIAEQ